MIQVQEAESIVLSNSFDLGVESIDLENAVGRVIAEDVFADRDLPPFNRVSMDGIAIRYQDFNTGQRSFKIEGVVAAGTAQQQTEKPGVCMEVMTGSVLPVGLDSVIRYEDIELENGFASVIIDDIKPEQNVHKQAKDRVKGEILIPKGSIISAVEIGICASVVKSNIQVAKLPKTIIISTGDELVDIHETPKAHQIRKSNVARISAQLQSLGIKADAAHLNDDKIEMEQSLKAILENYDLIILSGGVSKGKFDYVPEILSKLSVEKLFHKVRQRPGKPFWFGKSDSAIIFALPGNPNSSFVCTIRYVLPWIKKSIGMGLVELNVQLTNEVTFNKPLTRFLAVQLSFSTEGAMEAYPINGNGSGDFASLISASGFVELPAEQDTFSQREVLRYFPFKSY